MRGFDDEVGYRIHRDKFELPEITLEADEAAVIGLAARVWQHARLASATSQGLRKLRAAGVDVDESALAILEPQLVSDEPAFDDVLEAVTGRTPIALRLPGRQARSRPRPGRSSRGASAPGTDTGTSSGHDRDRDAPRMFRVSRIVGRRRPRSVPPAASCRPPTSTCAQLVSPARARRARTAPPPSGCATGKGGSLRREATASRPVDEEWTEIEVPYASGSSLAEELVSYGPDVIVVAPDEVRQSVVRRLGRAGAERMTAGDDRRRGARARSPGCSSWCPTCRRATACPSPTSPGTSA